MVVVNRSSPGNGGRRRRTGAAEARSGTQAVERTVRLLRELCTRSQSGWEVAELAKRSELNESTTRRLLGCLVRERLVARNARDGRYLAGGLLFELSMALPAHIGLQRAGEARLSQFARRTRSVASLFLQSGDDYVCIVRLGDSPVKGLSAVRVGSRHPLVLSSGGQAMLVAMPRAQSEVLIRRNFEHLERIGNARIAAARTALRRSMAAGFAVHKDLQMPGINAFAVAVRDPAGWPFAAISMAGARERFPMERAAEFRALLDAQAAELEAEVRRLFGRDPVGEA